MPLRIEQPETFSAMDLSLRRKIQGLLLFRLLMAIFFLLLTILVQSRRQEDLLAAQLQPLYFFSLILFVFTIVAALGLKNIRNLKRFAYLQLFVDVGAVTFLVYMSGGVESLFSFLYMPVIISASILLFRQGSLLIASLASLSYGLLLDLEYLGWIDPLQIVSSQSYFIDSGTYLRAFLMNIAAFYMVAFLSGYLAEELQRSGRQLLEKQKNLEHLETLHRNIVQNMRSGLLSVDAKGKILYCNQAAEEILKLPIGSVAGRFLKEIIPELDAAFGSQDAEVSQERETVTYQSPPQSSVEEGETQKGEMLYLGYTVSSFQEEGKRGFVRIIIFRDLTRLKVMEKHVERMERLAFAGRIAAEIAHEIKNPLGAMSGAVQMLYDRTKSDPLQSRLMDIVNREVHRINDLVTNFLWLARGTRKTNTKESVPVCSVIQDILVLLKTEDKVNSHHHIWTDFQVEPVLFTDLQYFRQILWNLLLNAIEVIPNGGDITVRVSLSRESLSSGQKRKRREDVTGNRQGRREIRIDVEDTGPGIPEDIKDKIFEPFFTTKEKGTGLGLSIVYQMVENADGRITVNPSPKGGTVFSLFFPFFSTLPLAKHS
jgi:two-component system sensor histidine kinase PilS (NtrC family)